MIHFKTIILCLFSFILFIIFCSPKEMQDIVERNITEPSKLVVLWTSGDRDVALKMVFMYTNNAKINGWWDEIRFIVWGPSSKLLSKDVELQEYIKKMKDSGVELLACKACADSYGVSEKLQEIGIEVKYMGQPLTSMLKSDWVSLTF